MDRTSALESWRSATRDAIGHAAGALVEAAPSLRLRDGWQQLDSGSLAVAGPLGGGQVVALVSCPTHVGIAALGLPTVSANRLARAVMEAGTTAYWAGADVAELTDLDTSSLGPGLYIPVSFPNPSGGPDHKIKLYAHGVADIDLAQLTVPAAERALRRLATAPAAA
ncbi:hypothetical protein ACIRPK_23925 [Kitasatospora sp. NPDC101801]|uniref:hypothetical protein n=1 Tax=Kitasatospora sp. NPDC101801 TaxID=3364103 RepID=UPI0037F7CA1F